MRSIGTISNEPDARRFANFLLAHGIACQAEPGAGGYVLWVRDEDRLEQARQELAAFRENPADGKYEAAASFAERLRHEQQQAEELYRKNVREMRDRWQRPTPRHCPLTIALVAISVLVAILSQLGQKRDGVLAVLFMTEIQQDQGAWWWNPTLPEIRSGEVWRLVTPIFIHFGPLHLLFNMWCLFHLGGVIEIQRGTVRLLWFVLATAVLSNLTQLYWSGPAFGGMSGVVYGLLGYAWMKSRFDKAVGLYLAPDTPVIMIVWLVLGMVGVIGNIANGAHVAGLVVGVVVGYAPVLWRKLQA